MILQEGTSDLWTDVHGEWRCCVCTRHSATKVRYQSDLLVAWIGFSVLGLNLWKFELFIIPTHGFEVCRKSYSWSQRLGLGCFMAFVHILQLFTILMVASVKLSTFYIHALDNFVASVKYNSCFIPKQESEAPRCQWPAIRTRTSTQEEWGVDTEQSQR